jgi:hypothetical protein
MLWKPFLHSIQQSIDFGRRKAEGRGFKSRPLAHLLARVWDKTWISPYGAL